MDTNQPRTTVRWHSAFGRIEILQRVFRSKSDGKTLRQTLRPFLAHARLTARGCSLPLCRALVDFSSERSMEGSAAALKEHYGIKLCGRFHPDYAIRFTKGGEHCDLLFCFGCGDARILHNGKVIHAHFYGKTWLEILAGYAKHRPKPEK